MNKMIGKISKKDWSVAPEGATHTFKHKYAGADQQDGYYKLERGEVSSWGTTGKHWVNTCHTILDLTFYCVSKEEDLEMNTKEVSKQVSSIEDLEVGMFLRVDHVSCPYVICELTPNNISVAIVSPYPHIYNNTNFSNYSSWSYTYDGEYTPIVKETEAEAKIKELEATIELAQKQLQEYKEMK